MNAATVARLLKRTKQTCTIMRAAAGATNSYGEVLSGSPLNLHTDLPCLFYEPDVQRQDIGESVSREARLVGAEFRVYLAGVPDIVETDQIAVVRHATRVIEPGPLGIKRILRFAPYFTLLIGREVS